MRWHFAYLHVCTLRMLLFILSMLLVRIAGLLFEILQTLLPTITAFVEVGMRLFILSVLLIGVADLLPEILQTLLQSIMAHVDARMRLFILSMLLNGVTDLVYDSFVWRHRHHHICEGESRALLRK